MVSFLFFIFYILEAVYFICAKNVLVMNVLILNKKGKYYYYLKA